ncbi:MAG TPA: hypothetical protein VNW29_01020 [Candidatus Sulfotelmatobacter sp.]|jgi:hypothetical protein|nr:hypothetical protein [Candidatus Sulfotelmatobacter sp.]
MVERKEGPTTKKTLFRSALSLLRARRPGAELPIVPESEQLSRSFVTRLSAINQEQIGQVASVLGAEVFQDNNGGLSTILMPGPKKETITFVQSGESRVVQLSVFQEGKFDKLKITQEARHGCMVVVDGDSSEDHTGSVSFVREPDRVQFQVVTATPKGISSTLDIESKVLEDPVHGKNFRKALSVLHPSPSI